MSKIPIKIPNYINSATYQPAKVLPRLFFYNGNLDCETYNIKNQLNQNVEVTYFPYFDNYNVVSGSYPTINSFSLLFNNEDAAYGETPTNNLYTSYWQKYIELLYNPRTRLLNAKAIIPLADYYKMNLNDVVEFRGNYYHLRYINDYNLLNGECSIQLLGPILRDTLDVSQCNFNASVTLINTTTTTTSTTTTSTTTTISPSTTTTTTIAPPVGEYNYYSVAGNCCTPNNESIIGVVAVTASIGTLVDGQTLYGGTGYTGSNGQHCVSVKFVTASTTPLLFTIGAAEALNQIYGTGQCLSCNRDHLPTPINGNCVNINNIYYFTSPYYGPYTASYIDCSGNAITQSGDGQNVNICYSSIPTITYDNGYSSARVEISCSSCGTYTTTTTAGPTTTTTAAPRFCYEAGRYECVNDECVYQEIINISNATELSPATGSFRVDPLTGYIFETLSIIECGAYLETNLSGVGSIVCNGVVCTTTTTTTAAPTTTTTTFSNNPCNCVEITVTSAGAEVATLNCYNVNENYVYMTAGTYYLCAAVVGGLLQVSFVSGTGTYTPIGNCKTGTCPPATSTTTTTTIAPTTTTTTNPYDYYLADEYVCDDCSLQRNNVLVGFPIGSSIVTANRYYNAATPNGFVYKDFTATTPGSPALLMTVTGNSIVCNTACGNTTTTTTTTAAPTTTTTSAPKVLDWSYTLTNSSGQMKIYVNGSAVETRSGNSSGMYNVYVGDTIYFEVTTYGCSGGIPKANSYTFAGSPSHYILSDASCENNSTVLTTGTYTVVSSDSTITVDAYSACDSGCL